MLAGYVAAQFRGDSQIVLEKRGVPRENVTRALTLFFLYSMLIAISAFLLSITENGILHRTARKAFPCCAFFLKRFPLWVLWGSR